MTRHGVATQPLHTISVDRAQAHIGQSLSEAGVKEEAQAIIRVRTDGTLDGTQVTNISKGRVMMTLEYSEEDGMLVVDIGLARREASE